MDTAIPPQEHNESGFSLVEVMVAALILVVGLVAAAQGMAVGLAVMVTSQQDSIARQKAREAMEDIFTARDDALITFTQVCNISAGTPCIFEDNAEDLLTPGPDGIVNTSDDGPSVETIDTPGPNGILGTSQDVLVPLVGYTRQVQITQITSILSEITVTIKYTTPNGLSRKVTLVALMSPYA
jgi:prepilin-type N-terminal cleavage/methylation domain-containing protein